jgi:hypothetical protein
VFSSYTDVWIGARITYDPMATPATAPLLRLLPLLEDDTATGAPLCSPGVCPIDVVTVRLGSDSSVFVERTVVELTSSPLPLPCQRLELW